MTDSLDDILASGRGETVPEKTETTPEEASQPEQVEASDGPTRDEKGRFAKGEESKNVPEASDGEGAKEDQAEPTTEPGTVPHGALHAAREKERAAREENARLQEQLTQMQSQMAAVMQRMQNPQPQAAQDQPQAPDFWEDADGWGSHLVERALTPFQQQVQQLQANMQRMEASQTHGADKVQEAVKVFDGLVSSQRISQADYQRVMNAQNPLSEAVNWYQQRKVIEEIGDDPASYRERLEAEIREKIAAEQAQNRAPSPAAMPSNFAKARNAGSRSGPAWNGPTPMSEILPSS